MEGDPLLHADNKRLEEISIHSLRMEGDYRYYEEQTAELEFQSTPSAWRETLNLKSIVIPDTDFNPLPPHGGRLNKRPEIVTNFCISIHSLRMEGDSSC